MNDREAAQVLATLTEAWPWADWPEGTISLWLAAISAYPLNAAATAAGQAIRELDRPPSIAWFHRAARAHRDLHPTETAALEAPPVDKAAGKRLANAARAELHARRHPDGGWP